MKIIHGEPGWSASFSDDGLFRFSLFRPIFPLEGDPPWERSGRVLFSCGLNPSVADEFKNDSTVRKELGFGRRWHCDEYIKGNAYAWRDRDPYAMMLASMQRDITGGQANDLAISAGLYHVLERGGIALAAWGNHCSVERSCRLAELARAAGVRWMCLGRNAGGQPKHSLYPPYDTKLIPWDAP